MKMMNWVLFLVPIVYVSLFKRSFSLYTFRNETITALHHLFNIAPSTDCVYTLNKRGITKSEDSRIDSLKSSGSVEMKYLTK